MSAGSMISQSFTTYNTTGATDVLQDADATPTGVLLRNGAPDNAVAVTVSHRGTGRYSAMATIPSGYADGDMLELEITATVASVTAARGFGPWEIETETLAVDVATAGYTGTQVGALFAAWAELGTNVSVADTAPTITSFKLGGNALGVDNAYVGQSLSIKTGALAGERRVITSYVGATRTAGFAATTGYPAAAGFTSAPATGDLCEIL